MINPLDINDYLISLGIAVLYLRKNSGMSQTALAESAELSRSLIGSLESVNLAKNCSICCLYKIAYAFKITPAEILILSEKLNKLK